MKTLVDCGFSAAVEWIGTVRDRNVSLRSDSKFKAKLTFAGIEGEDHGGLSRPSCTRVDQLYEIGTTIRNTRQLTLLSAEEIETIAVDIGVAKLDPKLLGANFVIRGIPHFTLIPPSSRIQFACGATITVDLENLPCGLPSREIERDLPGHGKLFKLAARRRRGITGWVEREGQVAVGDSVKLFIPMQPAWPVYPSNTDDHCKD